MAENYIVIINFKYLNIKRVYTHFYALYDCNFIYRRWHYDNQVNYRIRNRCV